LINSNLKSDSQLIVASHETQLIAQNILRNDEIWFVNKKPNGGSILNSLSDYKDVKPKTILKDYLIGRYYGIPQLGNNEDIINTLSNNSQENDNASDTK